MPDSIVGLLKFADVAVDAVVSLYGRFTGSDTPADEDQHSMDADAER